MASSVQIGKKGTSATLPQSRMKKERPLSGQKIEKGEEEGKKLRYAKVNPL